MRAAPHPHTHHCLVRALLAAHEDEVWEGMQGTMEWVMGMVNEEGEAAEHPLVEVVVEYHPPMQGEVEERQVLVLLVQ